MSYDYENQKWVDDDELVIASLREDIELLAGDNGEEFAAFIGLGRGDALRHARKTLQGYIARRPKGE